MYKKWSVVGFFLGVLLASGCGIAEYKSIQQTGSGQAMEDTVFDSETSGSPESGQEDGTMRLWTISPDTETMRFLDANRESHAAKVNPNVKKHTYQMDLFQAQGEKMYYEDATHYARWGIDVSEHQGEIDWKKVKDAGVEFAFIRLGYRGYGAGSINLDKTFKNNMKHAKEAGIDIGVYFFSQAVNVEEAEEEADFVLKHLKGYDLQLPVVFDPERIVYAEARTDSVSGEQFTENTRIFCEKLKHAGYRVMFYSNMLWEAYEFDLEQLAEYPIWYADYEPLPQTPYNFEYWQYSCVGTVPGIQGATDLNIQMVSK